MALICGIVAAVLTLSACGGTSDADPPAGGSAEASRSPSPTPSVALASFAPPREFGGKPVPISFDAVNANIAGDFSSRFTLAGAAAYGVSGRASVGRVDLATGRTVWETPFPHAAGATANGVFYSTAGPQAPLVSQDGTTVYAASPVTVTGTGTQKGAAAIDLVALDAETGEVDWSVEVPMASDSIGQESARVLTANDDSVLVASTAVLAAVSPRWHEVLWTVSGDMGAMGASYLDAVATDDVVVAVAAPDEKYPQLIGYNRRSGEVLWTGGTDARSAVGAHAVVELPTGELAVTIDPYLGGDSYSRVLNPVTGAVIRDVPDLVLGDGTLDGTTIYNAGSNYLAAVDAATLTNRWKLPTETRTAPRHPIVFGGMIYGRATGGAVILDGATGKDVASGISGTFVEVDEHGAIMLIDRAVYFVPATA